MPFTLCIIGKHTLFTGKPAHILIICTEINITQKLTGIRVYIN